MSETLMIGLLVLAGAGGSAGIAGLTSAIKAGHNAKKKTAKFETAVIKHERHLFGVDSAANLANETGKLKKVRRQVKTNDKIENKKELVRKLTDQI